MLNRHEKFAVFNLSLVVIAVLLFLLIWQTMGISKAPAGFAVLAFQAIGHLIFLRKKSSSEVVEDERDTLIKLKSSSGGYYSAMAYLVLIIMAVYFTHPEGGVVSVDLFPIFAWTGWAVYVLASSIIILVQYRKGSLNCGNC